MSLIGPLIRSERTLSGMTLDILAKKLGLSKSQLSLVESGKRSITEERVVQIETFLEISDSRLVAAFRWDKTPPAVRVELEAMADREQASRSLAEKFRSIAQQRKPGKRGQAVLDEIFQTGELKRWVQTQTANVDDPMPVGRRIPVINKVAAGYPSEFTDLDYPASIADDYIACPGIADPDAFAARVVGDSMEPDYQEGEIVVFSPQLPTPSGSDCFVRLDRDNETTFKRIFIEKGGDTIRLEPVNSNYPSRTVRREEIGGMYAAAYAMRKIGS